MQGGTGGEEVKCFEVTSDDMKPITAGGEGYSMLSSVSEVLNFMYLLYRKPYVERLRDLGDGVPGSAK
jgi:hypothetical protein